MTAGTKPMDTVTTDDEMADAFDQAFDFARGVFDRPALLDELPDKATLVLRGLSFHDLNISGHPIQLVAVQDAGSSTWTARISRWTLTTESHIFRRPVLDARSILHDQQAIMETFRETRDTSDAALDALEHRVRTAISDAIRFDPDGSAR